MRFGVKKRPLLVVAGEPSGDRAGARVVEQLVQTGRVAPFGIGGAHLASAGASLTAHIDELTALGMTESLGRLAKWMKAWAALRIEIERRMPEAALLIDAPEVNLPLARVLSGRGTAVVFYIGPQIWAWRRARLQLMRRRVSVTALILPFERELYDAAGANAVYVGHPILDEPAAKPSGRVRAALGLGEPDRLVALLPGSRSGEIGRHAGPLLDAAARLGEQGVRSVMASPTGSHVKYGRPPGCLGLPRGVTARDVLGAANAALVTSGSATLEAALQGAPMTVIYKIDPLSRLVARLLLDVPYVALPNWIAGRKIIPELLQNQVTGSALARSALELLSQPEQERQKNELAEVVRALGDPGAAERVAALVLERLR